MPYEYKEKNSNEKIDKSVESLIISYLDDAEKYIKETEEDLKRYEKGSEELRYVKDGSFAQSKMNLDDANDVMERNRVSEGDKKRYNELKARFDKLEKHFNEISNDEKSESTETLTEENIEQMQSDNIPNSKNSDYPEVVNDLMNKFKSAETLEEREKLEKEASEAILTTMKDGNADNEILRLHTYMKEHMYDGISDQDGKKIDDYLSDDYFLDDFFLDEDYTENDKSQKEDIDENAQKKIDELKSKKIYQILGELIKTAANLDLLRTAKDLRKVRDTVAESIRRLNAEIDSAAEKYGANEALKEKIAEKKQQYDIKVEKLKTEAAKKYTEEHTKMVDEIDKYDKATEKLIEEKSKLKEYKKSVEYKEVRKKIIAKQKEIDKALKEGRTDDARNLIDDLEEIRKEDKSIEINAKIQKYKEDRTKAETDRQKYKENANKIQENLEGELGKLKVNNKGEIDIEKKKLQKQTIFGKIVGAIKSKTDKINGKQKMENFLEGVEKRINSLKEGAISLGNTAKTQVTEGAKNAQKGIGDLFQGLKSKAETIKQRAISKATELGNNFKEEMARKAVSLDAEKNKEKEM